MRRLCLTFAIMAVVYVVMDHYGRAEAQQPCSQKDSSNIINQTQRHETNKPNRKGTEKSCRKNRQRRRYKLQRNRLGECKGKKLVVVSKRKKGRKTTNTVKKSKVNAINSETAVQVFGQKKQKSVIVKGTERVDDIPVLINVVIKAGIQDAIDKQIPVQKNQRELSWGRTAVIWLAYILTTGDHRKVAVEEYVKAMKATLSQLMGMPISERDFSDDRLSVLARYLSKDKYWTAIEQAVSENTIDVYELNTDVIRVDATTVSGFRETAEGELFQFGHSKDDPNRPQIKIMTGSLDPLGMPLASDVVSGERADDGLYSPIVGRLAAILGKKKGLLYVGDCKLASFSNRLYIKANAKGSYLCPLPNTGKTPKYMEKWIAEGEQKDERDELTKYIVTNKKGEDELKAKGYETERCLSGEIDGKEIKWNERVLIIKSPSHEQQQKKALETRLRKAEKKIILLTPPSGPGKRQITDEAELTKKVKSILKNYRVNGLLEYSYEKEVEKETKYVGKGRGSANRETRVEEKIRYQITKVSRNDEKISETIKNYGWKAFVTDVKKEKLGFIDIVRTYRKQYRVERIFNKLKSRLNIAPLYVKRKDQIKGMTHLLMLAVRVYTLIEFVVRRSLSKKGQKIVGLYPGNPKKATDNPTCERILKAFSNITLTVLQIGDHVEKCLTPLSRIQTEILKHLGYKPAIYTDLEKLNQYAKLKLE